MAVIIGLFFSYLQNCKIAKPAVSSLRLYHLSPEQYTTYAIPIFLFVAFKHNDSYAFIPIGTGPLGPTLPAILA